jgi:hypothetical protein
LGETQLGVTALTDTQIVRYWKPTP